VKANSKKTVSLFFILLGATPLLFILSSDIRKWDIKIRMKERTSEKQELQTIVLPESEVVWMDKHEIYVNDKMFDISTVKLEKGIYTFKGLYDEEETKLVKQQQKPVSQSTENMKLLSRLFKFLQNFYYKQPVLCFDLTQQQNNYPSLQSSAIVSLYLKITTPPPQLIC